MIDSFSNLLIFTLIFIVSNAFVLDLLRFSPDFLDGSLPHI